MGSSAGSITGPFRTVMTVARHWLAHTVLAVLLLGPPASFVESALLLLILLLTLSLPLDFTSCGSKKTHNVQVDPKGAISDFVLNELDEEPEDDLLLQYSGRRQMLH